MMQNSHDLDIEALEIAKSHKPKYTVDRKGSYKNKKSKGIKIVDMKRFVAAVGVVLVSATLLVSLTAYKPAPSPEEPQIDNLTSSQVTQDQYINLFSNIYGLKADVVKKLFNENRDYFNSINYLKTSGFQNYNEELEILTFVRHLSQKPEDFKVTFEEIKSNFTESEEIIEEQKVKYYSDLFGIDPALVLAIEYQESSLNGERYNSELYTVYNNPAGLMINGETFCVFPSKEAGIIEHIYQLKKFYIDRGLTTPEQIKESYAPDNAENDPNDYNVYWVENVKRLMEEIRSNPTIFDGVENSYNI